MKILVVATKSPWPATDGGRLVLWLTLQGLAAAGHQLHLIAPVEQPLTSAELATLSAICTPRLIVAKPRAWPLAAAQALLARQALTVTRHQHRVICAAVAQCIVEWQPELLHVEQLQALANVPTTDLPIVLRMQNVESALWSQTASARHSWLLAREAQRLKLDEQRAMARVARVLTLTEADAVALAELAHPQHRQRIACLRPPFPQRLAAAAAVSEGPAAVLAGSAGWWPNAQALQWFIAKVLPLLRAERAAPAVHVYGGAPPAGRQSELHWHPAAQDSRDIFPAGAIAAIPLLTGSGIRMRILEAWARGLPVVASSVAARGLDVHSGDELLLADDPAEFASALLRLCADSALREKLVHCGRDYLARQHDPLAQTESLLTEYRRALGR